MDLVSLLILLLVLGIVVWFGFWIVDKTGVPNPINWIAKAIVGVIALIILLQRIGFSI